MKASNLLLNMVIQLEHSLKPTNVCIMEDIFKKKHKLKAD